MLSLILLFLGTFWEASMDILGFERDYQRSRWKHFAVRMGGRSRHFGESFWNHDIAWRNKWKDGDPKNGERFFGSSTFLVFLLDGWHLMKLFWLTHIGFAIVLYSSITNWFVLDLLLFLMCFGLGHEVFRWLLLVKRV